jgi:hypothetical protein
MSAVVDDVPKRAGGDRIQRIPTGGGCMQTAKWRLLAWCAVVALGPSLSEGGLFPVWAATIEQAVATPVTATVTADAPIFVKVGMTTPLRVAAAGTTLRVLSETGEWTQVQFQTRSSAFGQDGCRAG